MVTGRNKEYICYTVKKKDAIRMAAWSPALACKRAFHCEVVAVARDEEPDFGVIRADVICNDVHYYKRVAVKPVSIKKNKQSISLRGKGFVYMLPTLQELKEKGAKLKSVRCFRVMLHPVGDRHDYCRKEAKALYEELYALEGRGKIPEGFKGYVVATNVVLTYMYGGIQKEVGLDDLYVFYSDQGREYYFINKKRTDKAWFLRVSRRWFSSPSLWEKGVFSVIEEEAKKWK